MNKLTYALIIIIFSSCSHFDYFERDKFLYGDSNNNIKLHVTGGITGQLIHHKIEIQEIGSYIENTTPQYITDAKVFIKNNMDTIKFVLIDSINGRALTKPYYETKEAVKAEIGNNYKLVILHNNVKYIATDSVVETSDFNFDDIDIPYISGSNISISNNEINFGIETHHFGFNQSNYWAWVANWQVHQDISYLNTLVSYTHRGAEPQGVFSNKFFQHTSVTQNDSILVAKYSVSENYNNYLRALFMETDWKESKFSTISGNLPTNFSKGATGFFFASDCRVKYLTAQKLVELNQSPK